MVISLAKLYGYEDSPPRTFELERETRWLLLTPTALWHADEADGEAAEVRRAAPPPRLAPPVAPIKPGANIGGGEGTEPTRREDSTERGAGASGARRSGRA